MRRTDHPYTSLLHFYFLMLTNTYTHAKTVMAYMYQPLEVSSLALHVYMYLSLEPK